jgi:hypothetical protein
MDLSEHDNERYYQMLYFKNKIALASNECRARMNEKIEVRQCEALNPTDTE